MVFYNPYKEQTRYEKYQCIESLHVKSHNTLKSTFYLEKINILANKVKNKKREEKVEMDTLSYSQPVEECTFETQKK